MERAGFQRRPLQRLRTDVNYATALFERSEDVTEHPLMALAFAGPGRRAGVSFGMAFAADGGEWMVTLMAYEPARHAASVEDFVRRVPSCRPSSPTRSGVGPRRRLSPCRHGRDALPRNS